MASKPRGLRKCKTFRFPLSGGEKKKEICGIEKVCSAHKLRKETSFMCSTCGVALKKIPCFGEYHTKKGY